jgi:ferredoxin-nitrite reductase
MFLKDEAEVFAMFNTLIALFRDFGFRDNRNKNRLFFLLEAVGMEAMRRSICSHAGIEFARAGELMTQLDFNDPDQGRVKLKDGTFALHVSVPSGVFSGTALIEAAEISQQYGNGGIRLDVEQSLYMMGLSETSIESALKRDFFKTYKSVNTPYFNHLIACAGSEHCPFGVIPNKPDAIEMAQYLSQAVPLEQGRVRMYWSGCIKGCGLHGIGDVGFEGCKAKLGGENVFGVHISLGGKITLSGEEGYSVIKAAPLSYAKYYVESLMLEYRRLKKPQESFEKFHDRVLAYYSSAAIGFMMKLKAYLRHKNIALDVGFDLHVKSAGVEEFEVFELGRKLYRALIGSEPYSAYGAFAPLIKERLQEPILTDSSVDANLSVMLVKMLRSSEEQARCFSELEPFIALYK